MPRQKSPLRGRKRYPALPRGALSAATAPLAPPHVRLQSNLSFFPARDRLMKAQAFCANANCALHPQRGPTSHNEERPHVQEAKAARSQALEEDRRRPPRALRRQLGAAQGAFRRELGPCDAEEVAAR